MQQHKGTVLVVDDDPTQVGILSAILELEGYHAITAYGPAEALQKAVEQRPDVVLTDVDLGDAVCGIALTGQICGRMSHSAPSVCVASADMTPLREREARKNGAYAVLSKPFTIDGVISTVAQGMSIKLDRAPNS